MSFAIHSDGLTRRIASRTAPTNQSQGKDRKRPSKHHRHRGRPPNIPKQSPSQPQDSQSIIPSSSQLASNQNMDSTPLSFEAKIALALAGNSWQQVQTASTQHVTAEQSSTPQSIVDDVQEPEVQPAAMTSKQKKQKAKFDNKVSRDAGDVLEVIEADSLLPANQDVVWDQDPELLCAYNWKASNDHTNTIFGTSHLRNHAVL